MNSQLREALTVQLSHGSAPPWRSFAVIASVFLLSSACDDGMRSATAPGSGSSTVPIVTFTLSGTVSEMTASGLTPVVGVMVREEKSRRQVPTDAGGFYHFSLVSGTSSSVTATKAGYDSISRPFTLSGDTRLDFEVIRTRTYILSGIVFEVTGMGRRPIQHVSVYCDSCGDPLGHTFAETDADGSYHFSWTNNGSTPLIVRKDGYRLAGNPPPGPVEGWIVAPVNGDTRFDIELVPR
jgi:hypothetical protein